MLADGVAYAVKHLNPSVIMVRVTDAELKQLPIPNPPVRWDFVPHTHGWR